MAGGTFLSYNKTLPGVYINVKSQPTVTANIGTGGTVAMAKNLSWGEQGTVIEIIPGEDTTEKVGYPITAPEAQFLLEMMRGSDVTSAPTKILLYRYTGTGGAAATISGTTVDDQSDPVMTYEFTAKCVGTRGNDIAVSVTADPDTVGQYFVETFLAGTLVDAQAVTTVSGITDNAWVAFDVTGTLDSLAAVTLTGGLDPTVSATDDAAAITAFEPYDFDILAYDGTTSTTVAAYVQFIKRMNEAVGKKCQLVVGNFTGQNSKYVIAVRNGVTLSDGTNLDAQNAIPWVAGAEAGAQYNQSLTYAQYPTAVSAYPKLTEAQLEQAVADGQIAFIDNFGLTRVCTDINSKTSVTVAEGAEFKKNRLMRVINQLCNDTYAYFSQYFIGKVDNNPDGRSLLRAWLIGYLNDMQSNNGIQNFTAEDVEVLPGTTIDAVIINILIQPVDSVEKIYITVTVDANIAVVTTA